MRRFCHLTALGLFSWLLTACHARVSPPPPFAAAPETPRERLGRLVERYWAESASLSPWYSWGGAAARYAQAPADAISPQSLADSLAIERRYLDALREVSRPALDAESARTYDVFRRERELSIESFTYPAELIALDPYDGVPQRFALMALTAQASARASATGFEQWRHAVDAYRGWTLQAIANLDDGLRRGYAVPRVTVQKLLPQLSWLGADAATNPFFSNESAGSNGAALDTLIRDELLPAFRRMHEFLEHDYLPRARADLGIQALPLGDAWYAFLIKRMAGEARDPRELFDLASSEVERVRARMQALLVGTAFAGNAPGFVQNMRRDLSLKDFADLKAQALAATPAAFAIEPTADVDIRDVEPFRQSATATVSYRSATAGGKNSAVVYINAASLASLPAPAAPVLVLRNAVPGRHYQSALQQERAGVATFRRFGGAPAFIEGWALYAASLGDELGLYGDPETKFESLLAQWKCAAAMVVDLGIHSRKWSRQQALAYLRAQALIDEVDAADLVDRDLALPGDALGCTLGFLKIQRLRSRAQQTLGERFDVRAFHTELLRGGALPLDFLEAGVNAWIEAQVRINAQARSEVTEPREDSP